MSSNKCGNAIPKVHEKSTKKQDIVRKHYSHVTISATAG